MLQIVYISTALERFSDAELNSVLLQSRLNNGLADVTGLLISGGKRFLQALEGPADAVEATFQRIKADPRHRAIVPLSVKQVETREFGAWSMGYQAGGAAGADDLRQVVAQLVAPINDKNLIAHFTGFAEIHARAA